MIIKRNARKPVARGAPIEPFIAPYGVGGLSDKYCVGFVIGGHRVIMTAEDFDVLKGAIQRLVNSNRLHQPRRPSHDQL